jgi:hypothetical protein
MSRRKTKAPTKLALTRRRNAAKRRRIRRKTAEGRLSTDDASSPEQMNRRALWIAIEWHLPRCPKIGSTMTPELADWCQTHGVSFDWLLCGDLKDLQRMMEARRIGKKDKLRPNMSAEEIAALVRTLPEAQQRTIEALVDSLLAERGL